MTVDLDNYNGPPMMISNSVYPAKTLAKDLELLREKESNTVVRKEKDTTR